MAHPISIENAHLIFLNFEGKPDAFNTKGERGFAIALDPKGTLIKELEDDGWHVKYPKERDDIDDEEDSRTPYLPVKVRADNYPPKVILIADDNKTILQPEEYKMIDTADIENVDLVITPYSWEFNGKTGISAYLKSIYVTLQTDKFTKKYGI